MSDKETLARVEALESRIAYQDRAIEDLSTAVTELWKQIDGLNRQVARLTERLQQVEDKTPSPAAEEPPPPHY